MANRGLLLCLILSLALTSLIDGKRWGSSSSGRSSSSWNRGGGSSKPSSHTSGSSWSKPSFSYPSSSSGFSGTGSGKPSFSYPSSSSGFSGTGSGKPSFSYPSSSSGLSGTGSGKPSFSYPSSSSGFSGTGSGKPSFSYPSSSTGLSGTGSSGSSSKSNWWSWGSSATSKPASYPSSPTGLSGSGSGKSIYPTSQTGLSGSNSGTYGKATYPASSSSGSHTYPGSSGGISGSGANYGSTHNSYHPSNTYNTNSNYGHGHVNGPPHVVNQKPGYTPNYYAAPQYVYVTEYRNSGSRYGDLLTGLALYNMGRSHNHYHDHYYYQDDYYRKRYNSDGTMNSKSWQQDTAVCTMKIKENGRLEILAIPCEIVSSFASGKEQRVLANQTNTTVCVSNVTMINNTLPANGTSVNSTLLSNVSTMNSTSCTTTANATDPLQLKGPPADPIGMECTIEIRTQTKIISNPVDCSTLIKYNKMPEPKRDNVILPDRQKLKSLLKSPPWWMSLFIAV